MNKKLISLLLILVLVVSLTVIVAAAEEATPAVHEHCVCGGKGNGRGDHVCADSGVITEWTEFSEDLLLSTDNVNRFILPAGNYYLTGKTTLTGKEIIIEPDAEVTFCLNGFELSGNRRIFRVNGTLNITDCQPTRDGKTQNGKITGNATSDAPVFYTYSGGHINLYRGILTASTRERTYGGVGAVATDAGVAAGKGGSSMTMYGGTIDASKLTIVKDDDGTQGNGGAVVLFGSTADLDDDKIKETIYACSFTQYGGTIKGAKSVEGYGSAIYGNAVDEIKILGNKASSGNVTGEGAIAGNTGCNIVVGGGAKVSDLYLFEDQTFTTENLTGSVGLTTEFSNTSVLTTVKTADEATKFVDNMEHRALETVEVDGVYQISYVSEHDDHCVCSGNLTDEAAIAAHGECVVHENWIPLDQATLDSMLVVSLPDDTTLRDEDGKGNSTMLRFGDAYDDACYYLTESVTVSKPVEIHQNDNITICLNGYTWKSTTTGNSALRVWGTLNITDCIGSGQITSSASNKSNAPVLYMFGGHADAEKGVLVNLYGGTLKAQDTDASAAAGVVSVNNASNVAVCTFNIYGGTITGGYGLNGSVNLNGKKGTPQGAICNMYGGAITDGKAASYYGGNLRVTNGEFYMYGGTMSGGVGKYGTLDIPSDLENSYNTNNKCVIDGKVSISGMTTYGAASPYQIALGENFATDTVIKLHVSNSAGKIITGATPEWISYFEPAVPDTYQVTYENKDIYLRSADVHYACYCGGAYAQGGSVIDHTCNMVSNWVAVDSQFLASSNTSTETVNGTDAEGNPTTEEVTTVTGFGTPVEDTSEALGGTYYHVPSGHYYLAEDITLEHGLRIEKNATVYIDLNGHTITGSDTNARPLFIQGSLRICDSSYDSSKENKAEQFQGGIIATRSASYNLCYVSGEGLLRIFGGNYSTTAESVERAIFGATGSIYVFDGYIKGANATVGSSVFELHEGTKDDGSVSIYRATIEAGSAKNGGIVTMTGAEEKLFIYSGNLIGTAVTNEGGVIYASKGTVTINGGTISGGSAIRGGNIFIGSNATLTVKGGEITGGSAIGADSDYYGGGGNIYAAGNVTISGGTISGGKATRTQSSAQAYGGNIYMNGSAKKLTISGGTIDGGEAVTGGNIFARGEFNMSDGTIANGVATEAIAGNIRIEGAASKCNITGGTISDGISVQQGGNMVVRNSANEVIISGATISGGVSQSSHGGNIYLFGITNNVTMENTTITGGASASRAGNLYITAANGAEDVVATLTNCTITDGTTGDRGGNVYIADVACTMNNCTVTGGSVVGTEENMIGADLYGANIATNTGNHATALTINGGTYGGYGENNLALTSVHILSSDDPYTVTVTGAPVIDDLRLGTDRMLIVDGLTEGADIGISRFEISGLVSEGAAQYADYFHATVEGVSVDTEGENLILVSSIPYWAFDANSNIIAPANTIAEALAMENVSFIRLVADVESTEVINGDLYVDLYGHDLSGLTVNGNLYVVDMATNDYEENVAGSLQCTVSGKINDGKIVYVTTAEGNFHVNANYVMVANQDGSCGFHRVSVSITHVSLKPAADALGYKATVSGDSVVKAAITGYGFNMGVQGGVMKSFLKDGAPANGEFTLRLQNILQANGGQMVISGQPVIFFGEESIEGDVNSSHSMKNTIESIEAAVAKDANAYSQAQIESVQALLTKFADKVAGWDIDSIQAWTAPTVEEVAPAA